MSKDFVTYCFFLVGAVLGLDVSNYPQVNCGEYITDKIAKYQQKYYVFSLPVGTENITLDACDGSTNFDIKLLVYPENGNKKLITRPDI